MVKLIEIPPLTLPKVLRRENVPILETRELQRFNSIENRLVSRGVHKDIQTISRGNDEKHFSHVLSMAGAPHVNTNLSLSLANGLNHSCGITNTPRQIISPAASFLDSPDVFAPREQGPGTILVSTQSAEKSLTRTVLTLSPSQLSSIFLKLRNMQSSLACVEHNHEKLKQVLFLAMNTSQITCQERSKSLSQVMFQTSVSSEIFSSGEQRVPSISIIFAPLKSSSQSSPQMLPPEVFSEASISPAAMLPTGEQTASRKKILSMVAQTAPLKPSIPPVIFQLLTTGRKMERNTLQLSLQIVPPQPSPLSLPVAKPSPQPPVVFGRELAETLSPAGHKLQRNTLQLPVVIAPPQVSPLPLRNPQQLLRPVMFGPLSLAETLSPVGSKVQRNKLELSLETVPPQLSLLLLPLPKPSPQPVVMLPSEPNKVKILPSARKIVQRKPLQLSMVTIPPQLFLLPLPAPSSTRSEILPLLNTLTPTESCQLQDFNTSKKVEINEDDVPTDNSALKASM